MNQIIKRSRRGNFILLVRLALLTSIGGCGEDEDKMPTILVENTEVLNQTLYANDTRGENSIKFTTTGEWTSSIAPQDSSSWISTSPKSDNSAKQYSVSITLAANTSGKDRQAQIIINCLGNKTSINVTQKATMKDGSVYGANVPAGVYAVGDFKSKPVLWTNTGDQNLGNSSNSSWAKSVFVSSSNVYVAGYERNAQGKDVATLWKNGTVQYLTNGT